MIELVVRVTARPERVAEMIDLLYRQRAATLAESGCLGFDLLRDLDDPCSFLLVERFDDRKALQVHRSLPHYHDWRVRAKLLQVAPRRREEYEPLAHPRRVIFTNGVFDLLHPGHIHTLQWARRQGDFLVVAVNSDRSVRRLKGPSRPVMHLAERMALLQGLRCVDHVVSFDDDTPLELVRAIRPHAIVKGHDYEDCDVIGSDVAPILIAPPSPFVRHTTDILAAVRG